MSDRKKRPNQPTPTAGGTYSLTLTVTDDDNGSGMETAVLTVEQDTYNIYLPAVFNPAASSAQAPWWDLLLAPMAAILSFGRWNRHRE